MRSQWRRLAVKARDAVATIDAVPSPCSSICRMATEDVCAGCLRTLDEIQMWSTASDAQKRQVWQLIAQRIDARLADHGAATEAP